MILVLHLLLQALYDNQHSEELNLTHALYHYERIGKQADIAYQKKMAKYDELCKLNRFGFS